MMMDYTSLIFLTWPIMKLIFIGPSPPIQAEVSGLKKVSPLLQKTGFPTNQENCLSIHRSAHGNIQTAILGSGKSMKELTLMTQETHILLKFALLILTKSAWLAVWKLLYLALHRWRSRFPKMYSSEPLFYLTGLMVVENYQARPDRADLMEEK